jgi:predicted XRE-type DNA-binding protein
MEFIESLPETRGAPEGPRLPRQGGLRESLKAQLQLAGTQFGIWLSIERCRNGWNQAQLAELLGVRQTDISDIETAKRQRLNDAQIDNLFAILGISGAEVEADYLKWRRRSEALG